jgi:hypothetical protein
MHRVISLMDVGTMVVTVYAAMSVITLRPSDATCRKGCKESVV